MPAARASWLTIVAICGIAGILLAINGYTGYAITVAAVGGAAAANLLQLHAAGLQPPVPRSGCSSSSSSDSDVSGSISTSEYGTASSIASRSLWASSWARSRVVPERNWTVEVDVAMASERRARSLW